jgi:Dullard-like phosphatase family protein
LNQKGLSILNHILELISSIHSSGDELKHNDTDLFSPHLKLTHHEDVNSDSQHDESSSLTLIAQPELEEEEQSTEEGVYDEFDPYYFIYTLPPHASVVKHGKICLPPPVYHHKRTLVLDLDETLVHCSVEPTSKSDFTFPVTYNAVNYQVYVKKRPYVDYFLESVSKEFEVIVFTASQQVYADRLLDYLDPHKKYFTSRLFREACLDVYGNFIKDLTVLNRDLAKVTSLPPSSLYPPLLSSCLLTDPLLNLRLSWLITPPMPMAITSTMGSLLRVGLTMKMTQNS